jgi:hypothetical protein
MIDIIVSDMLFDLADKSNYLGNFTYGWSWRYQLHVGIAILIESPAYSIDCFQEDKELFILHKSK